MREKSRECVTSAKCVLTRCKKIRLTFACRAICLTNRGRFRSETIFATVVSTNPSRSERGYKEELIKVKQS